MDAKLLKKLKRKKQHTLKQERDDLQGRQAILRKRRDKLIEERETLRELLYKAMEAKDDATKELLLKQISDIKDDISEINSEGEANAKMLECYSKVVRDNREGRSSMFSSFWIAFGTISATLLGKESLDRAYKANEEGWLVNKGPLDVFNRLNPTKILSAFTKK